MPPGAPMTSLCAPPPILVEGGQRPRRAKLEAAASCPGRPCPGGPLQTSRWGCSSKSSDFTHVEPKKRAMRVCSICLSLFLRVRTTVVFTTFHSFISFTLAPGSVKHERIFSNLSLFSTKILYCFLSTLFNQKGLQLQ